MTRRLIASNRKPPCLTYSPATSPFPTVRATRILGALALGLTIGLALTAFAPQHTERAVAIMEPLGNLWLRALQMTIMPLVVALLVTGIASTIRAARGGKAAMRTLWTFAVILASGSIMAAILTPALLALFPIPAAAGDSLRGAMGGQADLGPVPGIGEFLQGLIPTNPFAAAAADSVLPMIIFTTVFAVAVMRLPEDSQNRITGLFSAIADAMLIVIGWVLALAPIGVFALSLVVTARTGTAALGALAHYVVIVATIGGVMLIAAYAIAVLIARQNIVTFARAALPAQAVAISTQSSLATLPAMIGVCRQLGVRPATIDFVLPLAVALFRATGPAMNLAVAIYVAVWFDVELTPMVLIAGIAVATLTTLGAVSLPGAISFVTSIAPIAIAMGVPIAPLALLVAVEALPDLMRTIANVTMDIAVTASVDRRLGDAGAE